MANGVAEVEEADGEAAEDYGEVEPGEEGAFVGEEDFGFYAGGEGDAFAWGGGLALWVGVVGVGWGGWFTGCCLEEWLT